MIRPRNRQTGHTIITIAQNFNSHAFELFGFLVELGEQLIEYVDQLGRFEFIGERCKIDDICIEYTLKIKKKTDNYNYVDNYDFPIMFSKIV